MRPDHEGFFKPRSLDNYPEGGELHMGVSHRRDEAIVFALNDWVPLTDTGANMGGEEFTFIRDNDGE